MVVLLQDNFDRANSTSVPGSPQIGGPYTAQLGTWGITANQLYQSTNLAYGHLTFPAAIDVRCECLATESSTIGAFEQGPVVRWVDANNYWFTRILSGCWSLSRRTAGVNNNFFQSSRTAVDGDHLALVAIGPRIYMEVNNVVVHEQEDYWYSSATAVAGFTLGNSTLRIDNALATDSPVIPNTWGASPAAELPPDTVFDTTYGLTPSLYKGRDTALADESEIP